MVEGDLRSGQWAGRETRPTTLGDRPTTSGDPAHNLSHEAGLQPVFHFRAGSFGGNDDLPRCLDLTVEVGRFVGQSGRESLFLAGQLQV